MKHTHSQAVPSNRVIIKSTRLILFVTLMLITFFAQATSIFGQNLADRVPPANKTNTAVIFPVNQKARITLLTQTELNATVPGRAVSGDVFVSAQTGTSNIVPFQIGSSSVPTEAGEADTWDSTFSGIISADTVWDTNLLLTGDVTVPASVTLTINSGTTIFVSSNSDDQTSGVWSDKTELLVFGTLLVNGSESAPVYFTSDTTDKAPGNWGGIQIREGSTTSELSNCMIRYANEGVRISSINVPGGGDVWALIQNCAIQNNDVGINIRANTNWPSGVHLHVGAEIKNNLIANNVKEGIYLRNWCGYQSATTDPIITDNVIENNDTGIFMWIDSWWIGHVDDRTIIKNNTIDNNTSYGIYAQAMGGDISGSDTDSKPIIENNLLYENDTNIFLTLSPMGAQDYGFQDFQPTIRYNTIRDASFGILLTELQPFDIFSPTIDHNVFQGFDDPSSYAIANQTSRIINIDSNYWGGTPAEWDAGMPASSISGTVYSSSHLNSTSPPIITRFAPEIGQPGESVTIYGANFGARLR